MKRIVFFVCLYFTAVLCLAQINSLADSTTRYNSNRFMPHSTKLMRAWYATVIIRPTHTQPFVTGNTWLSNAPRTIPMNFELTKINSPKVYGPMARPETKRFNYNVLTFYKREPFRFESFDWDAISRNVMRLYRPAIKITRYGIRVKPF